MKRNMGWIWYYGIVLALAITGTVWLAIFNLSLQLTPEEVVRQYERWKQHRPADYDLTYSIKHNDEPRGQPYEVRVRKNAVVFIREEGLELPDERVTEYTMDAIFELMRKQVEADTQPGRPKVYTRARFHPDNGAVLEYVRRVMRTSTRLEIAVQKFLFGPDLPLGASTDSP